MRRSRATGGRGVSDDVGFQRSGDAHARRHWMAEARYRGTKVVTVSPDYADNTSSPTSGCLRGGHRRRAAMAMGHGLDECLCRTASRSSSTRPPVHRSAAPGTLEERDGAPVPGSLDRRRPRRPGQQENAAQPVLIDGARTASRPGRGFRGVTGRQVEPRPGNLPATRGATRQVLPLRHRRRRARQRRGVPVRGSVRHRVTVFDLCWPRTAAPAGPARGLAHRQRRHPAPHPGLAGADHRSVGRQATGGAEFARNAEESGGGR